MLFRSTITEQRDGRQHVRIVMCNKGMAKMARAEALKGIAEAKADIARERELSADMRRKIADDLERQAQRLRAEQD